MTDYNTPELALIPFVSPLEFDVDGGSTLTCGGIACFDGNGRLVPGSETTSLIAVGRTEVTADNSDGANGAIKGRVKPGIFRFANSDSGDEIVAGDKGLVCYIAGEATVAITDGGSTRSKAGVVVDVDDDGVWVAVGFQLLSNPAATPAGTIQKKTVTVAYNHASFLAESDDGDAVDINVGTALPVGAILVAAKYEITSPFVGAGLATLTMIVGFSGDTNGIFEAVDILGDAAAIYGGTLGTAMGPALASAKQLVANFDPDNAAGLDELTAGSITIDVYYFVAF